MAAIYQGQQLFYRHIMTEHAAVFSAGYLRHLCGVVEGQWRWVAEEAQVLRLLENEQVAPSEVDESLREGITYYTGALLQSLCADKCARYR